MNLIKKFKGKIFNILLVVISLVVYVLTELYWQSACMGGKCSVSFMDGVLSSVKHASMALSFILTMFLFFPASYLKRYLTVWFWWLFILAYSIAVSTAPVGGSILAFNRSQVVLFLGGLGIMQAAYFIYSFHKKKKRAESEVR